MYLFVEKKNLEKIIFNFAFQIFKFFDNNIGYSLSQIGEVQNFSNSELQTPVGFIPYFFPALRSCTTFELCWENLSVV